MHSRSGVRIAAAAAAGLALVLTGGPSLAAPTPDPQPAPADTSQSAAPQSAASSAGDGAASASLGEEGGAPAASGPASPTGPSSATGGTEAAARPAPADGALCPADATTIAQIQATDGASDDSAMTGTANVRTCGVVTSSHPRNEGGLTNTLDGFTIQTPGSGGSWDPARAASDGIFVWMGTSKAAMPPVGKCVVVTGTIAEYPGVKDATAATPSLTQITRPKVEVLDADCSATVTPVTLPHVPTSAQLEALESMLVAPQGTWTITDNYHANSYGTLSLTPGTEPLRQATDVVSPGAEAIAYEAENTAKAITLDDGSSANFQTNKTAHNHPFAYLTPQTPSRVGTNVTFTKPVLVDSRHGEFIFQPTTMVAGFPQRSPLSQTTVRPEAPTVDGDIRVATFNVLNYFTDLGQDEAGCGSYKDRDGTPVTTNRCNGVRGAYTRKAFEDQQAKIVRAIAALRADVVALEEIENPTFPAIGGTDRDASLKALVAALNAFEGSEVWAPVPSPATVPAVQDAIRTAFIHRVATVAPVGESVILDDAAFTGVARQPLAQEFRPVVTANQEGTNVVVIANHFKSKGSVPKGMEEGNTDSGDGQGNANAIRVAQAQALATFAGSAAFAGKPVLLVGDFNSYSKEDPVKVLLEAGFTHESAGTHTSYAYSGRVGSLDHVFSNAAAHQLVRGTAVWAVNAEESVAFEYSRANANVTQLLDTSVPWRSSDHNPEIIGLDLVREKQVTPPPAKPGPSTPQTPQPSTPAPSTPAPAKPSAPAKSAPAGSTGSRLARTGSATVAWVVTALALAGAGGVFLLAGRGRRRS
ncbi:ExeM/NucH family extracellular endonuclease [Schaalia sp. 19OD2882]|uniref:ExeM/NucH family extracellular endonuclease n=1 Tax=Schaalia sp. 19OD2882 TaxID=2794089 RepID=UPI001C1F0328|nr:ExeM/NucH family extracellular endonuclease [Schaalia sp. 19OD2882]QWW19450.1 ExeM/NucH family extracellular endonuclease [Schaalia sp. 19OD2882]